MELSSARELKATLTQKIVMPVASRAASFSYSIAAQPIGAYSVKAAQGVAAPFRRSLALGITRKKRNDFMLALRIQDRCLEDSREVERIHKQARGEVDIRYIGKVVKCPLPWYRQRQRPLRIGCSVGHFNITAGTIGCFVAKRTENNPAILLLSNNHVLANENKGKKGDAIIQPGTADLGANPVDSIGSLESFVRLQKDSSNRMDAALASLAKNIDPNPAITDIGKISGVGDSDLAEGRFVFKVGRTTGLTKGKITAFEMDDVVVGYDMGNLKSDNVTEVEGAEDQPFAQGGDSGSLVVNENKEALGLIFAASDVGGMNGKGLGYVNSLSPILDRLEVKVIY